LITHVCKPSIIAILREGAAMNAWAGWVLAVAAVAAGYLGYGWPGVALAVSVVAFWLLLQFSRALRALRHASGSPVGQVPNAVMFNARLQKGTRLPEILKTTRSLGRAVSAEPEVWAWADAGGDEVWVHMHQGRVTRWELRRAAGST
jgi:hypothetical protein